MRKRGQITAFIIIGIVLLIGVGIFFYYKSLSTEFKPAEIKPTKEGELQQYVTGCLDRIGEDAILQMGAKGGYIRLPNSIENNPAAYIREDSLGLVKVPFWYSPNDPNQDVNKAPPLEYLELQLKNYINESLPRCLANFTPLSQSYNFINTENYTVEVVVGEENVITRLSYPFTAVSKAKQEKFEMTTPFISVLPVRLKRVHDLAIAIMNAENQATFFENMTVDLVSSDPAIPLNGLVFQCGQKIWYLNDIIASVKFMLADSVPRVRFENTDYRPFLAPNAEYEKFRQSAAWPVDLKFDEVTGTPDLPSGAPEDAYDYFHFLFKGVDADYSDLKADAIFRSDWPLNVFPKPSNYGILRSSETGNFGDYLKFVCVNVYHFVYDVQYPVEVIIRDDKSFDGRGYNFKFAFPVLIRDNLPYRRPVDIERFNFPDVRLSACDEFGEQKVDVKVYDSIYFSQLEDVNISFRCMRYLCPLGATKADGGQYRLQTQLPAGCVNGDIVAEKEGYLPAEQTVEAGMKKIDLKMTPLKKFNFSVMRKRNNYEAIEPIDATNEVAFVHLTEKNKSYETVAYFPPPENESSTIELLDSDAVYNVDIVLTEKRSGAEDYVFLGGFAGNWTVKTDDYYGKDNLTFISYAQWSPRPKDDADAANVYMKLANVSMNLTPRFG